MYRSTKQIINISLTVCMISMGAFLLLCLSAIGAEASIVQFSTTGGMSEAGDGPQQILIERIGDTDNESMNVSVIVLDASLDSNEYDFGPAEFYWAPGDNSTRTMYANVTTSVKAMERQTITFGLCQVDGGGSLGDPSRYEMVIRFPSSPVEMPDPAIDNGSPTLAVRENTSATATIKASTSATGNKSGNTTEYESTSAQDMPIVLFGGLVSLVVVITAIYLILFKRN